MQKKSTSESGLFNPRILLAFVLCLAGASLAFVGFAASPPPPPNQATQGGSNFAPIVRDSLFNGVSPNLRDLPVATPVQGPPYIVNPILPIHPPQLSPMLSVQDLVQQTNPPPLAMPTPISTFEGMNQADGCGNCIPPDPDGA